MSSHPSLRLPSLRSPSQYFLTTIILWHTHTKRGASYGPRRSQRCVQQMRRLGGAREKSPHRPKTLPAERREGAFAGCFPGPHGTKHWCSRPDKKNGMRTAGAFPRCCAAVSSLNTATLRLACSSEPDTPRPSGVRRAPPRSRLPNCWAALAPSYTQGILSKWHRGLPLRPDQPELPSGDLGLTPPAVQAATLGNEGVSQARPQAPDRLLPLPALPAAA